MPPGPTSPICCAPISTEIGQQPSDSTCRLYLLVAMSARIVPRFVKSPVYRAPALEMAIRLAVSRSFPIPMVMMRVPSALMLLACEIAAATASPSLTDCAGFPFSLGLPSEAKMTKSGWSGRLLGPVK